MTADPPTILIAGVGNIFFGDDAFGVEAARQLMSLNWPACVRVQEFGIAGLDLAYQLVEGVDILVLLDAIPRDDAPGTVHVIEADWQSIKTAGPSASAAGHSIDPLAVLNIAASLDSQLKRVFVVGCQPSAIDPAEEMQMGLSPPVQAAIPQAIELVRSLVEQLRIEPSVDRRPAHEMQ